MRSGRLLGAVLAGVTVGGIAPVAVPPVAAGEPGGWTPVFAADFSGETLPDRCAAFDGPPAGQAAAYYRPDETQVSGGMLRLSIRARTFAYSPYTSGGLGCQQVAQLYGRYEFRARMAPGAGIDSYVTLWPEQGAESDVTVMEVSAEAGAAQTLLLSNGDGQGVTRKKAAADFGDGFHEYVLEWAPSGVRVVVDGEVKIVDGRASLKPRWLGFAVNTGDEDSGLPPGMRGLPAEFLVDWVRVYAYAPGASGLPTATPELTPSEGSRSPGGHPGASGRRWSAGELGASLALVAILLPLGWYALFVRSGSRWSRRNRSSHRA